MHADAIIGYLLDTVESESTSISYLQVLCSEILTLTVQNCGGAFRSKFVITLNGIIRLLTLIDGLLDSADTLADTAFEVA